jgi:hypothetical protein
MRALCVKGNELQHVKSGNLIGVEGNGKYYYFLVLSKSAFFGCQWAYAFHKTSSSLLSENEILNSKEGYRALIDFIEERRENQVIKISKQIDISLFFKPSKLKARIDTYGGGHEWFIYSPTFSILKKQRRLMPWQKKFPIASGMKCKEAFTLTDKKWVISQVVRNEGEGQFPFK